MITSLNKIPSVERVFSRIREIEAQVRPDIPAISQEDINVRFEEILQEVQDKENAHYKPSDGNLPLSERLAKWEPTLQELSGKYDIDANLVRAVMKNESGGQEQVVSSAGAIGLMQLMPGTAKALGVDPHDPARNLEGGIKYLAQLSDRYGGDLEKTLAAYNAGPGRVDSYGGIPPFNETKNYVKNVLAQYRRYSRGE